jgi:hypothetical protein
MPFLRSVSATNALRAQTRDHAALDVRLEVVASERRVAAVVRRIDPDKLTFAVVDIAKRTLSAPTVERWLTPAAAVQALIAPDESP